MELEQRVKTLEYEMKILKNEIQRTLLDIQEQILVHYYPSLRSEEDQVPETARQAVQTLRTSNPAPAAPPPAAPPPVEPAPTMNVGVAPPPAPGEVPTVRKVTLEELRAQQEGTVVAAPPPVAAAPAPSPTPAVAAVFGVSVPPDAGGTGKLLEWTLNAAAAIGLERTQALLTAMTARKIITPEIEQSLQKVAPLNRRMPPEVVGVREVIQVIMQMDAALERTADIEEALSLIEEAKIG